MRPIIPALLLLSGCTAMQAAGVPSDKIERARTMVVAAAADGQLICQAGSTLLLVAGVNVKGARADAVARACAVAEAVGAIAAAGAPPTPTAAPPGATAVIATVPADVAAQVKASAGGRL